MEKCTWCTICTNLNLAQLMFMSCVSHWSAAPVLTMKCRTFAWMQPFLPAVTCSCLEYTGVICSAQLPVCTALLVVTCNAGLVGSFSLSLAVTCRVRGNASDVHNLWQQWDLCWCVLSLELLRDWREFLVPFCRWRQLVICIACSYSSWSVLIFTCKWGRVQGHAPHIGDVDVLRFLLVALFRFWFDPFQRWRHNPRAAHNMVHDGSIPGCHSFRVSSGCRWQSWGEESTSVVGWRPLNCGPWSSSFIE